MTTDGGKTWQKTLYIDNKHGVADLDIDPSNPNILYAAMWHFERKPWTHRSGSEQGGVFKSIDGGRTWNKLSNGLPKLMGRIGVKANRPMPIAIARAVNPVTATAKGDGALLNGLANRFRLFENWYPVGKDFRGRHRRTRGNRRITQVQPQGDTLQPRTPNRGINRGKKNAASWALIA